MKEFDELIKVVKKLRSPDGCSWDRAQKIGNMKTYLIEETYELIDEIEGKNSKAITEELGDVLSIIVVICEMFSEKKKFSLKEVLDGINDKLISRHPHVFSDLKLETKEDILRYWIKSKAKKKKRKTIKDRLPLSAPSLQLVNIFLKEKSNLAKEKDLKFDKKSLASEVAKDLNALVDKKKSPARAFEEILINLASLAYESGVDLELVLRKSIIEKAEKIAYFDENK